MTGSGTLGEFSSGDKQAIEYAAMSAVIQIETSLGYKPKDVSVAKSGYDVESYVPESQRVRFTAYQRRGSWK